MTSLAILHPTSLVGKELREALEARPELAGDLRLLSSEDEEIGTLTEMRGELTLIDRGDSEELGGTDVALFCGSLEESAPFLERRPEGMTAILLCPDAGPTDGIPVVAGVNSSEVQSGTVLVSPHPGAVLLAHLLHGLRDLGPTEAVATLIAPASMHGEAGLDELFEQSRHIIAMVEQRPPDIFGRQLAFNLFPGRRSGAEIEASTTAVLGTDGPAVGVQVVQGAVFHGVSTALHVRFAEPASARSVRRNLGASTYFELAREPELLGPIEAAAGDKILVGPVREVPATGGLWIWAVMDNLTRGSALNAIGILEELF